MRRCLILIWLVASLLGYGWALAADLHGLGGVGFDPLMQVDAGGDAHHADGGAGPDCDHCCHGSAHLLGLGRALEAPRIPRASTPRVVRHAPRISFFSATPFRPPII